MMSYEPGLRWLCADKPVNYHTLSDFRTSHKEKLGELFSGVLAVMDEEGLIDLRRLMQDGTKMRAVASKQSFHREGTLRGLGSPREQPGWCLGSQGAQACQALTPPAHGPVGTAPNGESWFHRCQTEEPARAATSHVPL